MSGEDARRTKGIGEKRPVEGPPALDSLAITADERAVLEILVACRTARTAAQLSAGCGLARDRVTGALDGLRSRGLVTRVNTLVESYVARFPGIEV